MSKIADWLLYVTFLALVLMIVDTWKEARETNRLIGTIVEIITEPRP